jgi:hypothetical protein
MLSRAGAVWGADGAKVPIVSNFLQCLGRFVLLDSRVSATITASFRSLSLRSSGLLNDQVCCSVARKVLLTAENAVLRGVLRLAASACDAKGVE